MKTPDNTAFKPSSGTAGFFQSVPRIQNQWLQDESLNRIAERKHPTPIRAPPGADSTKVYLPKSVLQDVHAEFKRFGEEVLSKHVIDWVSDAERNLPYVKGSGYDSFGHRVDELVTSEGWKRLQELGLQHGYANNDPTADD